MKYYITTPIYYATAKPHLGSLYSTVLADIANRWHVMQGFDTFFLTGTDEHGQKIANAAAKLNLSPKELLDQEVPNYKHLWAIFKINYNKFIRTTDDFHKIAVQKWLTKLLEKDLIYKDTYNGWYCTPCETFVKDAPENSETILCNDCQRETTFVCESAYFFKLSEYQDKLLKFYKNNPEFIIPVERFLEVIRFVETGLKDLCISRASVSWGIPFPKDESQTVYVWADALSNYITAIGYMSEQDADFNYWWPADIQIMGKDIVRFHAVYWLAFLMALDLPLPKNLLVHGWIKIGEQKMSKSLGNAVDPETLAKKYGAEEVRYYLASQLAINHDSEFSIKALENCINADLVNGIGNLLNRSATLALNSNLRNIKFSKLDDINILELKNFFNKTILEILAYWQKYQFHLVVASIKKLTDATNKFFHQEEPWKIIKQDRLKFEAIIATTFNALRVIAHLLWPIMPSKMTELLDLLGLNVYQNKNLIDNLQSWQIDFNLKDPIVLFKKIEINMQEKPEVIVEIKQDLIDITDFAKIKIVVGTILECQNVEKSDKLVLMKVDCGEFGLRQILSGVRPAIQAIDLIGKQSLFIVNLKPRKVMGFESQGMMLSAAYFENEERKLNRLVLVDQIINGSLIG